MFIGLSFAAIENRVVVIADSEGHALADWDGLDLESVLEFIWYVRLEYGTQSPRPVYVSYQFSIEWEILFEKLCTEDKNKLYGIRRDLENGIMDTPLYDSDPSLDTVEVGDFRLWYLAGKFLRVGQPEKSGISVYDISGYFSGVDLSESAAAFLGAIIPRVNKNELALWSSAVLSEFTERAKVQAVTAANLGQRIYDVTAPVNLNTRQYYGPSAIASKFLGKHKARKQGKKLNRGNAPEELLKAIDCAYFGGRVEAIKLGTINDVRTFDLNSAYAYATTLLSQFHKPLRFQKEYAPDEPFGVWFIDYSLPKDIILGAVPTRSPFGALSFRRAGRGYYWQPEVDYLLRRYPDFCEVKGGYVADYEQIEFAPAIRELFDYRMQLKNAGDKGESIIKLALSNLYGKFAQNKGAAFYQCRAWAGWITSLIRRLMLDAVTGIEDKVISFNQDAVHLQGVDAKIKNIGVGLGDWKRAQYDSGLYIAPGLYEFSGVAGIEKSATRGTNQVLDFEKIAADLSNKQVSELTRAFFVGWNLAYARPLEYMPQYLTSVEESLRLIPQRLKGRNYKAQFDWLKEYRDSTINQRDSGLQSARYHPLPGSMPVYLQLKESGWA